MKPKTKKLIQKIISLIFFAVVVFAFAPMALATDFGLSYGTYLGFGTQDFRVMIMRVVQIALGFLGIIAIILFMYGGWLYLSSAGNEEKITRGKQVLVNAVIGLVIIFTSFAIVSFIINMLSGTSDYQPPQGITCTANQCVSCGVKCNETGNGYISSNDCVTQDFCSIPPDPACPKPTDSVPTICKIEPVRGLGFGGVPQGYVGDYVTIEGWYFGIYSEGISQVKFNETEATIATCENDPIWQTNVNNYGSIRIIVPQIDLGTVNVSVKNGASSISNAKPFAVIAGTAGPGLACLVPPTGKNNEVLTKAEGVRFGASPETLGGLFFNQDQKSTYISWADQLISQPTIPANAISGNVYVKNSQGIQSNGVWFTVSCLENGNCTSGCCKNFMCQAASACQSTVGQSCDSDLTTPACQPGTNCAAGLVCDNNSCLCALPGYNQPCDTNLGLPLCQGGNCATGFYCEESTCTCQSNPTFGQPIIYGFSPTTGAVGTYVTIAGGNFGPDKTSAVGHVYFVKDGTKIEADYSLIEVCNETSWRNSQIIVKVPAGLNNGDGYIIEVENSKGRFDTAGLNPSAFTINESLIRPNICKITPDNGPIYQEVEIFGENLNPTQAEVNSLIFSSNINQSVLTLTENNIFSTVPTGAVSGVVKAKNSKNNESNALNFQVGTCVVGGCQSGYECCQGGKYNLSCMPTGGCYPAVSMSSFNWDFTTGSRPGNCSNDSGICVPNNEMCAAGYTCDTQTCNCTPTGAFNCSNKPYPVCEPNSDLCPANQFCGATCTCLTKIPCDGNIATPACQPSDDICRSTDPSLACDPSTCFCDTRFIATKATYNWTFNSYTEGPQVVDECNRTPECAKVCAGDRSRTCGQDSDCVSGENDFGPCIKAFSSPSPKYNRDGEVYANSQISVSFDQEILPSTVNSNTIKLYKCSNASGCSETGCSQIGIQNFSVFDWDYGRADANGVIIRPSSVLESGYCYKAEVTAGVIGRNGFAAAPYTWKFKIKEGTGSVGCATCQPGFATLFATYDGICTEEVGDPDCQKYQGQAWDQDHICVMLKPETLTWNWNLLDEDTDKRASIFNRASAQPEYPGDEDYYLSSASGQGFDVIDVYARKETLNDPVKVATEINGLPASAYQYNENICDLNIDLSTPIVIKRWPDCNGACTNASVGAAFSIPMNENTITAADAVTLFACGDNANCRPGYGVCSITGNDCNAADGSGCDNGETCQALAYDQVSVPLLFNQIGAVVNGYANSYLADTPCFDINADGKTDYCLLPNTYYRVILKNTIAATNGKTLGKLNYDDALYGGISSDDINDSYSWVFKTQNNMCAPGRVSVVPEERHINVNEVQKYASFPYTSPDSCDPQGQPLIAASFVWEWQSKYCQIADLFANTPRGYLNDHNFFAVPPGCTKVTSQYASLRNGCGNGFVGLGEDCDDGNLVAGDGCSDVCLNEGAGVIENLQISFNGITNINANNFDFPFPSTDFSKFKNYPLNGVAKSWFGSSQNSGLGNSGAIFVQSNDGRSGLMKENYSINADRYSIKVKIKFTNNIFDINDIGLIFGYQNQYNYWNVNWKNVGYTSETVDFQQLKIERSIGGIGTLPQAVANTQKVPVDQNWHEFKVEITNYDHSAEIKFYLDDNLYLTYDANTRIYGNAGIYAYDSDSRVWFDDLSIEAFDAPSCGNGIIEKGEECEKDQAGNFAAGCANCLRSGNTTSGPVCGNGVLESGEECDSGSEPNNNEADGCTNYCTLSGFTLSNLCGNGIVDKGEACDDGDFTKYTCLNQPSQACDPDDDTACGNNSVLCSNRAKSGDGCTGYYVNETYSGDIDTHSECSTLTETQCKTFSETPTANHAKYCYWTGAECRIRPCLKESNSPAQGNNRYSISVCGNGKVEAGEECDYGSLCQTSYGGVARCTSLNASSVCANGICGEGVCQAKSSTGHLTNQYVACNDENAGELCYSNTCDLQTNSYLPGCSTRCLNSGSVADNKSRQIAQGLSDDQTEIQAWSSEFQPSSGGPMGIAKLFVGAWGQPEDFYVIDQWPNCFTACLNADIGAQFSQFVASNSLTASGNIKLYECRSDSSCTLANARRIGINVIPFAIKANTENKVDAIQILLLNSYNPVDHDNNPLTDPIPALLPGSYYRVVISGDVRTDTDPAKKLQYLNFNDPTVGSGTENDSYSWVFKTQNTNNFCALSAVKILPQTWQMFTGNKRQLYFSRPLSRPDECSANGQLLNPFYFDWRWDDVEMSQDGSNFISGADILTDTPTQINGSILPATPPADGSGLKDGCGNGVVEFGEDCDPGLQSISGCSNNCQHTGTAACSPTNNSNCCGNSVIDPGEECERKVNGGYCTANGLLCDPVAADSCPGGTCISLCAPFCLFAGNTNTQANCGDGVISPKEICDGKLGDDSDGCSDYCLPSGAVPVTGSTCGNGSIEKGEECDGGELLAGNVPTTGDGNNCTGVDPDNFPTSCSQKTNQADCQTIGKFCYWTGKSCKWRPCIKENRTGQVCRNTTNLSFDFSQNPVSCKPNYQAVSISSITGTLFSNRPVCGNAIVEPGEECDLGGWCIDDATGNLKTCTTYDTVGCRNNVCTTNSYFCSVDGLPTSVAPPGACTITGVCDSNKNCVVNGPEGSKIKYSDSNCTTSGATCTVTGQSHVNGCSSNCVFNGSSHKDGIKDPYQIVQSVSVFQNTVLTEVKEEIRAWHALQPDRVGVGELTILASANVPFTVVGHQPQARGIDTTDQCRNVGIWAILSKPLDVTSVTADNLYLGKSDVEKNIIKTYTVLPVAGTCNENHRCVYPGAEDSPLETSYCYINADCVGSKVVINEIEGVYLEANASYILRFKASLKAQDNSNLQELNYSEQNTKNYTIWGFDTSADFCSCNYVGVNILNTSGQAFTIKDYFTCAGDNCGSNSYQVLFDDDFKPKTMCRQSGQEANFACDPSKPVADQCGSGTTTCSPYSNMAGNQHLYNASCYDTEYSEGTDIPVGLGTAYDFAEVDPLGLIYLTKTDEKTADCVNVNGQCLVTPGDNQMPRGKNGSSQIMVSGKQYMESNGQICAPSNVNAQTCLLRKSAHQTIDITNFICDNPWPSLGNFPYTDSNVNGNKPSNGISPYYNFTMYYCRDFGKEGTADDLPSLNFNGPVFGSRGEILKEFLFPVGTDVVTHAPGSPKKGVEFLSEDCAPATMEGVVPSNTDAYRCNVNSHFRYQFTGVEKGYYKLVYETYNFGWGAMNSQDLLGLKMCDKNKNGFISPGGTSGENVSCNTQADCASLGADVPCLPVTHEIVVFHSNVNDLVSIGKISASPRGFDNIQVNEIPIYLEAGDHTFRFRWINDWNASIGGKNYDSNLAINKVSLIKIENEATSDAIGLRILPNALHLSAPTWYNSGLCGAQAGSGVENICFSNNDCAGKNLFKNANFEDATKPWIYEYNTASDNTYHSQNGEIVAGGRSGQAAKLAGKTTPTTWGYQIKYLPPFDLPPGNYTYSAWVKPQDSAKVGITVQETTGWTHLCTNIDCNLHGDSMVCANNTNNEWQKITCNFSLAKKTQVQMALRTLDEAKSILVDDVSLTAGCNFNLPSRGTAQSLFFDGYGAVSDGRSLYVNATNFDATNLYSNIFLLSYTQNAGEKTKEIFRRLSDQTNTLGGISFNANLSNHRLCSGIGLFEKTSFVCTQIGVAPDCRAHSSQSVCESETNQKAGCYWNEADKICNGRMCLPIYCQSDKDCPNLNCDNQKATVVRDNIRFGNLRDMQLTLERNYKAKGGYPKLSAGTYIASTTFGVWPSWQATLNSELGGGLFTDPLNYFAGCVNRYCDNNANGQLDVDETSPCLAYDLTACGNKPQNCLPTEVDPDKVKTCWDEKAKQFSCPAQMYTYAYRSSENGKEYELYTNFEFITSGWVSNPTGYVMPFYGAQECKKLNFEIHQTRDRLSAPVPNTDCSINHCWGASGILTGTHNGRDYGQNNINDCGLTSLPACPVGYSCTGDADSDGVCDEGLTDNCAPIAMCRQKPKECFNPDQRDSDGNGKGDICDNDCSGDKDSDGICDDIDNCVNVRNADQADRDGDGIGDVCDPCTDMDSDGYWDYQTPANDEKVCPKDNCSPFYSGYCQNASGQRNGQRCHDINDCVAGFKDSCFVPFNGSFGVSNDRPKYCIQVVSGKDVFASKKVCATNSDCPTGYSCLQAVGLATRYFNPNQEDYDNSGRGYICNDCLDYDKDGLGDWTFYTKSSDWTTAGTLSDNQKEHFKGCRADQRAFDGFTSLPITPSSVIDLDNCPGGPYAKKCFDNYGVERGCDNSPVDWTDENGVGWLNSQPDIDLNNYGDLCDPSGDGRLDPGEACDCGDLAISRDEQNPFQCTTLNDVECAHSERYGDCCKYCATDPATGQHIVAESCGPRLGDGIVNGTEECDCGLNQTIRDSITDPTNIDATATSGIPCLEFDTSAIPRTIFNGIDCGPITTNNITQWSMNGYSCQWCDMGRIEETAGPYFGDGIVDTDVSGGLEQCDCGDAAPMADSNESKIGCQTTSQTLVDGTTSNSWWYLNQTFTNNFGVVTNFEGNVACKKTCTSFNGQECKPDQPCNGVCAYCKANDANTGSEIARVGQLCLPCSENECNSYCINIPGDGCCRDGETSNNEYGCPFKIGDQIVVETFENNRECGKSKAVPYCHPALYLELGSRHFGGADIISADGSGSSLFDFFQIYPGDPAKCTNSGAPTPGSDGYIKSGNCIKLKLLDQYWLTKDGVNVGTTNNETDAISWVITIDDGLPLRVGSKISLKDASKKPSEDQSHFYTDWPTNFELFFGVQIKMKLQKDYPDLTWTKYRTCNRAGICSRAIAIEDVCVPPAAGQPDPCQVKNECERCVQIYDSIYKCSPDYFIWNGPNLTRVPILSCSGTTADGCCQKNICIDSPSASNYDIDCDGLKIFDVITLRSQLENNNFEYLTGGTGSDGDAANYIHVKMQSEAYQSYQIWPAETTSCRMNSTTYYPMPGTGNSDIWSGGGRDQIRHGDCISLKPLNFSDYINMNNENWYSFDEWLRVFGGNNITKEFIVYNFDNRPGSGNVSYGDVVGFGQVDKAKKPEPVKYWWKSFSNDSASMYRIGNNKALIGGGRDEPENVWFSRFEVCKGNGACAPACDVNGSVTTGCPLPAQCYTCVDPGSWNSYCQYLTTTDPNTGAVKNCGIDGNNNQCFGAVGQDNCCVVGETWNQDSACPLVSGSNVALQDDYYQNGSLRSPYTFRHFLGVGDAGSGDSYGDGICTPAGVGGERDWRANRINVDQFSSFTIVKCDKYKNGCVEMPASTPIKYGDIIKIVSNRNFCSATVSNDGVWPFPSDNGKVEFGPRSDQMLFKVCSSITSGSCAEQNDQPGSDGAYGYVRKGDVIDLEKASWAGNWWAGVGQFIDLNEHKNCDNDEIDNNKNEVKLTNSYNGWYLCEYKNTQSNCACTDFPGTIACGDNCVAPKCSANGCDDGNPCTDDYCDPCTGCQHVNVPSRPGCTYCSPMAGDPAGTPYAGCASNSCQTRSGDNCCSSNENIQNEPACPIKQGDCVKIISKHTPEYPIGKFQDGSVFYATMVPWTSTGDIIKSSIGIPSTGDVRSRSQAQIITSRAVLKNGDIISLGSGEGSRICQHQIPFGNNWFADTGCDSNTYAYKIIRQNGSAGDFYAPSGLIMIEDAYIDSAKCMDMRVDGNKAGWFELGDCDSSNDEQYFEFVNCN